MLKNNSFIKIQNRKGQSTLEFAMLIPFVLLVIFAVSQFVYIAYIQNKLTQAAREGVRIVSLTNADNKMYEQLEKSLWGLDESKITIEVSPSCGSKRQIGESVELLISYTFPGFLGVLDVFSKDSFKIISKASMIMECN
jgi:uncharacterized protein (UPF0333 family)